MLCQSNKWEGGGDAVCEMSPWCKHVCSDPYGEEQPTYVFSSGEGRLSYTPNSQNYASRAAFSIQGSPKHVSWGTTY